MKDVLENLKDIHLPAVEPWWHLAWGWWLVLVAVFLCGIGLYLAKDYIRAWRGKHRESKALQSDVRNELIKMRVTYEGNHDALMLLSSISIFLRRASVTVFERSESAGVIGDEWLYFLDKQWGDETPPGQFSNSINANLLKNIVYQEKIDENLILNITDLLDLTEKWSVKVLKNHV